MKIKLAITDDHPVVREGLHAMLGRYEQFEVTGIYKSGGELLNGLAQTCPQVLLLDINLPDLQGDELAEILSKKYPELKILVLTNLDSVYHIQTMMEHKVQGYVLKDIGKEELVLAIETVYRDKHYFDDRIFSRLEKNEEEKKTSAGERESPQPERKGSIAVYREEYVCK